MDLYLSHEFWWEVPAAEAGNELGHGLGGAWPGRGMAWAGNGLTQSLTETSESSNEGNEKVAIHKCHLNPSGNYDRR